MRKVKLPSGHKPILYGEAPFGWRLSPDRSALVKDADEQKILTVVRHMYLSEHLPMRFIVEKLRKMGIENRRGRPFGLSGVWEMIHKRNELPDEAGGKKGAKKAAKATKTAKKAAKKATKTAKKASKR